METTDFVFNLIGWQAAFAFAAFVFAGIIDGTCGGGGLITVPAMMATGMPPHMVIGTNQCSCIPGSWTALYKYAKSGKLDWDIGKFTIPAALVGAFIGSKLNLIIDEKYLQILMMVLIPILVGVTLLNKNIGEEDKSAQNSRQKKIVVGLLIAFFVSIYHAFYGPASGTFYMVAFVAFLGYDAVTANGFARLILAVINVLTSLVYGLSGYLCVNAITVATIGYVIGNYIGAQLAISKGIKYVKPIYYAVLVLLLVKLVVDLIG